ncbi:MAG: hypothetical protein ACI9HK_000932 [Pirellulaceae bacterium]|jgi:hypothetical protein
MHALRKCIAVVMGRGLRPDVSGNQRWFEQKHEDALFRDWRIGVIGRYRRNVYRDSAEQL